MPLFEWDFDKAKRNLAEHGVDFETAKDVFLDGGAIIESDDSDPGEERWRIIGRVDARLLFVVVTGPDDDVIRIISAREASKREERLYYGPAGPKGRPMVRRR